MYQIVSSIHTLVFPYLWGGGGTGGINGHDERPDTSL